MNLYEKRFWVARNAFVSPSATIVGEVEVLDCSSVWYGAVIRGETERLQSSLLSFRPNKRSLLSLLLL